MNQISLLKTFLSQVLQNYLIDISALVTGKTVATADVAVVDCFAEDKQGEGENQGSLDKFGISKKAARVMTAEKNLGGEVVREADEGKVFEKLIHDGHTNHIKDADTKKQLQQILNELESGQGTLQNSSFANPNGSPVPLLPNEMNNTLFAPVEEDDREGQDHHQQAGEDDANSENDNNDGDPRPETPESLETNQTLQSRLSYQKMNTFM